MIQEERQAQTDEGEPLFTEHMSLTDRNGSVGVTIPSGAVKIFDLTVGDELPVEVYQSGVWVPRGDSNE